MKKLIILIASAFILAACLLPLTASECRADGETLKLADNNPQQLLPTETITFQQGYIDAVLTNDMFPGGELFSMKIVSVSSDSSTASIVSTSLDPDGTCTFTALPSGVGKTAEITLITQNSRIGEGVFPLTLNIEVRDSIYYLDMDWANSATSFVPGQTRQIETHLDHYVYDEENGISVTRAPEGSYRLSFSCDTDYMSVTEDGVATVSEGDAFLTIPVWTEVKITVTDPDGKAAEYGMPAEITDRYCTVSTEPYWTFRDGVFTGAEPAITVTEYSIDNPDGQPADEEIFFMRNENTSDALAVSEDGRTVTVLSEGEDSGEGFAVESLDVLIGGAYEEELCRTKIEIRICHHNYEITRTEPTYRDDGSEVSRCTICGKTETKILPHKERFTDVDDPAVWYFDSVYWAVEKNVTSGMGPGTFQPDTVCTRAMVVSFLYNLAGKPETEYVQAFPDVKKSDWFAKTVTWAVQNGVTNGFGDGTFRPNEKCNRAMIVSFIRNFTQTFYPELNTDPSESAPSFPDVPAGAWYEKPVRWAAENGITSGRGGYFRPDNYCTRAEVVTFLRNLNKLTEN